MKVLLAKKFNAEKHSVNGWMVSEKLDGMRAYWDGENLLTRGGKVIHAPEWFTGAMPDEHLDGELHVGRGKFQRTVSICRKDSPIDREWEEVTYQVFDAPMLLGTFEERYNMFYSALQEAIYPSFIKPVKHFTLENEEQLPVLLKKYEEVGAEGLMLRNPESEYEFKRSKNLLKVKSFHDDDATIVGVQEGEGRNEGRMGALVCVLDNGTRFKVGTGFSDEQREGPPEVGERITFSYFELTDGGVPRFPVFVGVRIDK